MGSKLSQPLQLGCIGPVDPSATHLPRLHPASMSPATQRRLLDAKDVAKPASAPVVRLNVWGASNDALATQHPAESAHGCFRELSSLGGVAALVVQLLGNIQQRAPFVVQLLNPLCKLLRGFQPIERLDATASFVLTLKAACPMNGDCKTLGVINNVYD